MAEHAEVAPEVVDQVRAVCLSLPEAYEERAWVGTRWRVRTRTFADVLLIDAGWPPAYARAARDRRSSHGTDFPLLGRELDVLRGSGRPFFPPPWRQDEVGMLIGADVEWSEVAELLTDSDCLLASKGLSAQVNRPPG